jgi:tetratricopeptide (TPR) repeat protein
MRLLFFLFIVIYSYAYELYVYKKSDYLTLNNIGIVCQKNQRGYLCAKSPDLEKLTRVKKYLTHFGVNAEIIMENSENKDFPKNGYCIQVLTSKKLNLLENVFEKVKPFPYARIEKIGGYYVIRIGQQKNYKSLKNILKNVKKDFKSAFIRKCDYIPERIVKGKSKVTKKVNKKELALGFLSRDEKLKLLKKYYYEKKYDLALKLAQDLKKGTHRKKILIIIGKIYYFQNKFDKSCRILSNLDDIYNEDEIKKYKNKACYEYLLKKASNQIYIAPYAALSLLNEAKNYGDDYRLRKYIAFSLVNMKEYKKAYPILEYLFKTHPNDTSVYLNYARVLFALGKFDELDKIANEKFSFFRAYEKYKKALNLYSKGKYKKAYSVLRPISKLYPDDKNINLLMAKVLNKQKRPDYAMMYLNHIIEIYGIDTETLKIMRDIYFDQQDFVNAYNTALKLKSLNIEDEKNKEIFQEYYLLKAFEAYKRGDFNESLNLVKNAESYMDNVDIFDMRGDIYLAMEKYKEAYKNYFNAYSLGPTKRLQKKIIHVLFKLKELEKAKKFAMESNNHEVMDYFYIQLAQYYLDNKDFVKANIILQNVKNKKSFDFYEIKGIVCFYLKNYDCALNNLKKAFKSVKRDYYLIQTYIQIGQKKKALTLLHSFPRFYDYKWKNRIANIYIQLGMINEAKEILGDI